MRDMTTFEFFLAMTFAASAGANSCYLCTDGEYIVDENRSPKLNALFQVLKKNDNKGCAENEGSDVLECDGDKICMLLRASFTIRIIDEDGTYEIASLRNRTVRTCSPQLMSQYVEGCIQFSDVDRAVRTYTKRLSEALGEDYTGKMDVTIDDGFMCEQCCDNNTNDWSANDITLIDKPIDIGSFFRG